MKVCNLSSGSEGNCTYVETNNIKILIDCGLSAREIEKRLTLIGVMPPQIDAILITHEHNDHIKGLDVFANKNGTKVLVHEKGIFAVYNKMKKLSNKQFISFSDKIFKLKDLEVESVCLPHDSVYCSGYILKANSRKVSIATDLGHVSDKVLSKLCGSSLVFIECNHDENMLMQNEKYPANLKSRILSNKGHISNITCAKTIEKLVKSGTKQIVLSHLSKNNNTDVLAYSTVCEHLKSVNIVEGENVKISVASTQLGDVFILD